MVRPYTTQHMNMSPLGGLMFMWWVVYGLTTVLLYGSWWALVVVLPVSVVFGMATAESVLRTENVWDIVNATRLVALPLGDGELPPPGFTVITCEDCGQSGAVPDEFVRELPEVVLCARCMPPPSP